MRDVIKEEKRKKSVTEEKALEVTSKQQVRDTSL